MKIFKNMSRLDTACYGIVVCQSVFIAMQIVMFPSLGSLGAMVAGFCSYMPWVSFMRSLEGKLSILIMASTFGIGVSFVFWMALDHIFSHYAQYHEIPLF